jgi:predicted transcriptional regulator
MGNENTISISASCKKLFYSQKEFAIILGISPSSVYRLLKNQRNEYPYNQIRRLGRRVLIPHSVVKALYGENNSNTEASNG